jgi:hypothetical protein
MERFRIHSNEPKLDKIDIMIANYRRRRKIMLRVLQIMAGVSFLVGLLMVIGVVGSVEVSAEGYTDFKYQIIGGFGLMALGVFIGDKVTHGGGR